MQAIKNIGEVKDEFTYIYHLSKKGKNFMNNALQLLKSVYGYNSFRPLQKEIIDHVVSGQDALVLMPTGVANQSAIRYLHFV